MELFNPEIAVESLGPILAGLVITIELTFIVITLSLMILLTVIAVGLLTLSSISLRVSSQGDAMAKARAKGLAINHIEVHYIL